MIDNKVIYHAGELVQFLLEGSLSPKGEFYRMTDIGAEEPIITPCKLTVDKKKSRVISTIYHSGLDGEACTCGGNIILKTAVYGHIFPQKEVYSLLEVKVYKLFDLVFSELESEEEVCFTQDSNGDIFRNVLDSEESVNIETLNEKGMYQYIKKMPSKVNRVVEFIEGMSALMEGNPEFARLMGIGVIGLN